MWWESMWNLSIAFVIFMFYSAMFVITRARRVVICINLSIAFIIFMFNSAMFVVTRVRRVVICINLLKVDMSYCFL